jgi:predicted nucleic acid-binding protein
MATAYLLDTTVLLHWTRGKAQATAIEQRYNLLASPLRPLVCEVSLGEMLAFSRNLQWSDAQRQRMKAVHEHVTVIDISDRRVLEAYADLSTLAQSSGWGIFQGKNDLWVAAAAKVANAHLITMDKDFLPLRGREGWTITILDSRTALPLT